MFAFQSLNKLGPLVANYKIGSVNSAYTLQDQLSQLSAHLGALSAIFVFQSLNKLGPLVAD